MKRLIPILLLITVLLLAACGSGASSDNAEQGSAAEAQETAAAEQEAQSGGIVNDGLMTLGSVEGDVYENESLGYGCKLTGWEYASSEDLAAENEWATDNVDEELQELIANSDTFMDMFAEYSDDESYMNVNVNVENMNLVSQALLDEQDYVDAAYPQMEEALVQAGFSNIQVEKITVNIGGDEHPGMMITSEYQGIPVFQKQACVKCGEYMASITASAYNEDVTDNIFALFYKL